MNDQPYLNQPNEGNQQGTAQPSRGRRDDLQEIPGHHPGFRPLSGHQPDRSAPTTKVAGFQPVASNQRTLPWFDQSLLEEMVSYSDRDGFRVYITQEALVALHQGTQERVPREAFGVLTGRAYQGSKGVSFTVVTSAVYARNLDASAGHVHLTAEQMRELQRVASTVHPAEEFVGWTHSHSSLSNYSSVDHQEQRNWPEEHNVGILTFMNGSHFPVVYRGPFARRLVIEKMIPLEKGETLQPAEASEGQAHHFSPEESKEEIAQSRREEKQPALAKTRMTWKLASFLSKIPLMRIIRLKKATPNQPKRSLRTSSSFGLTLRVLVIWQILLTIGLVTTFFLFDRNILALRSELVAPAPSTLTWSCTPTEGSEPLKVTCNGSGGSDIINWFWDFGDGNIMIGRSVTHIYQHPGPFTLNFKVFTPSLTLNSGSIQIRVDRK